MAFNQGSKKPNASSALLPGTLRLCAAAVVCALYHPVYAQDEIAAFRLTGVEGHVELRYREDEDITGSGGSSSTERRTSMEEEVFLLTHSYIYHPNFLKMDLGLGPVFTQQDFESTAANRSDDSLEYNVLARLHFLDEKPYPLLLFYDRDHPTVALTVTDRFQQQSERYGFEFQLREPILPFKLSIGASHHLTEGEGFTQVINDEIDQATVRAEMSFKNDGYGQFVFNTTDSTSESGYKTALPIEPINIKTDSYTFDSRVYLGDHNQYILTNYLIHTEQSGLRPLDEWRYNPQLRWTHSENLESFYRLNYTNSDQVDITTENFGGASGFRYKKSDKVNLTGELHFDNTKSTGLDLNTYGVAATATYKKDYSFGTLNLNGGWSLDNIDRVASTAVPVRDLIITISGTQIYTLLDPNINISTLNLTEILSGGGESPLNAVTTCGVGTTNEILYRFVGVYLQLERCPGVSDPITISVDYDYDPGGSVEYRNLIQAYQASLQIYKNYNIYARYSDSSPTIISGTPTSLEEYTNTQVGARVDYPLFSSLRVGGEAIYETQDGSLNSYDRNSLEFYLQFGLFNGVLYANTQHVTIDYAEPAEDVDLVRNALQFRVRPWSRVSISAELNNEEETGGSTYRKSQTELLTAEWRLRRLIMQAEARHVTDTYGASERERTLVKVTLRREF